MKSSSKLLIEKAKNRTKSIVCLVFGINCSLVLLGSIGAAFSNNDGIVGFIVAAVIFGALGALCISVFIKCKKEKKIFDLFTEYCARLSNDPDRSIVKLANGTHTNIQEVTSNIEYMLKRGLFANAYIDYEKNALVLPKKDLFAPEDKITTTKCECCGAVNKIVVGAVGTCEYCGSPIS